jgi:DNA-directed RNA polymerase subunit alpha
MSQDLSNYPTLHPTFTLEVASSTDRSAVIAIEPLEQGYGHTLGNALRRVLLSSLPGQAPTEMRIEGANHQYSTVEGVSEDVLEISLNLKQLRIKSDLQTPGVMRLSAKGPKVLTAADFEVEGGYEIINTDQHIATLAKGAELSMEVTVQSGMGYVVADEKQGAAIGDIMLDALFSPVVKVSYTVESTRVGRRTDYDRIMLNITTDGTIEPITAVEQAARILAAQFSQVFNPVVPQAEEPESSLSPEEAEVLRLTVEELDLPTRIANALRKGGMKTVGDLVGTPRNVIAKVKNLGEKSVDVIDAALEKKGARLGT